MNPKFSPEHYPEGVEYKITGHFKRNSGVEQKVYFPSCYVINGVWHRQWFYIPDGGEPKDRGSDPNQELGWEYQPLFIDFEIDSIEEVCKRVYE